MRTFYEEWSYLDKSEPALLESDKSNLAPVGAKLEISNWNQLVPKQIEFPDASFFATGFSHHRTILSKVKDTDERIFLHQEMCRRKIQPRGTDRKHRP